MTIVRESHQNFRNQSGSEFRVDQSPSPRTKDKQKFLKMYNSGSQTRSENYLQNLLQEKKNQPEKLEGWGRIYHGIFSHDGIQKLKTPKKKRQEIQAQPSDQKHLSSKFEILKDTHDLWQQIENEKAQEIKKALSSYIQNFSELEQVKQTMQEVKQHLVIEIKEKDEMQKKYE